MLRLVVLRCRLRRTRLLHSRGTLRQQRGPAAALRARARTRHARTARPRTRAFRGRQSVVPRIRQGRTQRMDRPLHLATDDAIAEPELAIRINPRIPRRHCGTSRRGGRELLLHAGMPQLRIRHRHRRLAVRRRLPRSGAGPAAHPRHHGLLARVGSGRLPRGHGRQPRQGRPRPLLDETLVAASASASGRNLPGSGARIGMG